jgi:hypothetical protein
MVGPPLSLSVPAFKKSMQQLLQDFYWIFKFCLNSVQKNVVPAFGTCFFASTPGGGGGGLCVLRYKTSPI